MSNKTEEQWAGRPSAFLKVKLREKGITLHELAERLAKLGLKESETSLAKKLGRGSFSATFFLICLTALELESLKMEDVWNARN
jgi:Domain of unknown function (DUF6471)